MIMPAAHMSGLSSQLEPVGRRRVRELILRRRAACEELDRTPLNLISARPATSKGNLLLIEGMHDLMVAGAPIELRQSWGQPELWRLPHGHISTALTASMPGLSGRVLRWLAPRLDAARRSKRSSAPLTSGEHQRRKATIQQTYFVSRIPSFSEF